MTEKEISKFLSYVLRHGPESIGLTLDANGWVDVNVLLEKAAAVGRKFDRATLESVVANNDKKRFTLSDDGRRIRAAQGHSIEVDLDLEALAPPAVLFHGTARHNLDAIIAEGLKPGQRQKVHLSDEQVMTMKVAQRHGKPVLLVIDARAMHAAGYAFWRADNGVWLTDHVPPQFVRVHD